MSHEPKPQFHPISALPMIAAHLESWLALVLAREGQFGSATACALDDALIAQTLRVYGEMKADLPLFEEQLRRWRIGPLSLTQREKLTELGTQLTRIRAAIVFVLSEAERLRGKTAEALAGRSDRELELDFLCERIDAEPKPPAA